MKIILLPILVLIGTALGHAHTTPPASPSADTIIATVLDKTITMKDVARLNGIIFGTLLDKYVADNKIIASEGELNAFVVAMDEGDQRHLADLEARQAALTQELQSPVLADKQRKQKESSLETVEISLRGLKPFLEQKTKEKDKMRPMQLGIAKQMVTKWKINKALYDRYGGRVIFQQAGDEPMDAYQAFLKDEEKKGSFHILDEKCKESFWEYFGVGNTHTYSKEEADKAMSTPWWMRKDPNHP